MKILFVIIGFIFLGLGVIGIYLPLMPATPFLLIATYCFARGSEKFNNWFLSTKLYNENIKPIQKGTGLTIKKKKRILFFITIFFIISFILVNHIHARICMIFVLLFHYYYFIYRIKTINE